MLFTLVDVILVGLLVVFMTLGFMMGLIGTIGALVGLAAGIWVANNFYQPVANWLSPYLLGNLGLAKSVSFIVIFLLINRLTALIFWLISKLFNIISLIPFLKSINRFGGMFLGLVEGVFILGAGVYVLAKFSGSWPWLVTALNNSQLAHLLVFITQLFINILP